jgi:hypothetical protein
MSNLAVVYAHQGGWDEILLVAAPIAVIVWLLRMAERRADRSKTAAEDSGNSSTDADAGDLAMPTKPSDPVRNKSKKR